MMSPHATGREVVPSVLVVASVPAVTPVSEDWQPPLWMTQRPVGQRATSMFKHSCSVQPEAVHKHCSGDAAQPSSSAICAHAVGAGGSWHTLSRMSQRPGHLATLKLVHGPFGTVPVGATVPAVPAVPAVPVGGSRHELSMSAQRGAGHCSWLMPLQG